MASAPASRESTVAKAVFEFEFIIIDFHKNDAHCMRRLKTPKRGRTSTPERYGIREMILSAISIVIGFNTLLGTFHFEPAFD